MHPLLEQLIVDGDFGDATEVTLRVAAHSGQRLVLTDGDPKSVDVGASSSAVLVASIHDPGDAALREQVAGRTWRVSARSFFQTSDQGAAVLVDAVTRAVSESAGAVVDLYAGVGLLGGSSCPDRLVEVVESNPSSAADAVVNLGPEVTVRNQRVERWTAVDAKCVIADPARRGLEPGGVAAIQGCGASNLVLVSCDPAALGRDAALLSEQGWRLQRSEVVDMFPDTSRIEALSVFSR